MKGVWKREGYALLPASDEASEALSSVKDGAECMADVKSARHPKQHRTFWKLLTILSENGVFQTKDAALVAVKIGTGHVETCIMPDTGQVFYAPRSIAFESMAQADFSAFMRAAIDLMCDKWLGGDDADKRAIRNEIMDVLDDPALPGERVRK